MDSVLGGGVLLAVAAALWLAYLVPNWLRRSEYLATERNAVRLQQTLRVLAETAETPEAIRLENAAKARALEAKLRIRQRPVAVGAPALLEDPTDPKVIAAARLRRTRIVTTVVIGIAALALLSQVVTALIGGIAAASGLAVVVSSGFLGAGLWLQGRLAKAQRASRRSAVAAPSARTSDPVGRTSREYRPAPLAEDSRAWTPQPLPQPLHQVRREAAVRAALEAEREGAAREAEERRVAAAAARVASQPLSEREHASSLPERAPLSSLPERAQRVEGAPAPDSRFAAMGVVGDLAVSLPDIDGALARRRAS